MQITVDLPHDLEKDLIHQAEQLNIPLHTFIMHLLQQSKPKPQSPQWPDTILTYKGAPDFPNFESYRSEFREI